MPDSSGKPKLFRRSKRAPAKTVAEIVDEGVAETRALLVRFDENRFCHLMGARQVSPGTTLLYFNLPAPIKLGSPTADYPPLFSYLERVRKAPDVWVDASKPFWWDVPVLVALGQIAFRAFLRAWEELGERVPQPKPAFSHAGEWRLNRSVTLIASYHPSQQNTQTGSRNWCSSSRSHQGPRRPTS